MIPPSMMRSSVVVGGTYRCCWIVRPRRRQIVPLPVVVAVAVRNTGTTTVNKCCYLSTTSSVSEVCRAAANSVHRRYTYLDRRTRYLTSSSSSPSSSALSSTNEWIVDVAPGDTITVTSSSKLILPSVAGLQEWRSMVDLERIEEQQKDVHEIVQPMVQELYSPNIHLPSAPTNWSTYEPNTPITETLIALIGVSGRPISIADYMRIALTHPQHGYYTNATTTTTKHHSRSSTTTTATATTTGTTNSAAATAAKSQPPMDDFDVNDWDTDESADTNTSITTAAATTTTESTSTTIIGADFVTAPEISHVFGECIGVWFATQWQQQQQQQQQIKTNTFQNGWQWLELGPGKGTLMVDLLRFTLQLSSSVQAKDNHNNNSEDGSTSSSSYFGDGCQCIHFIERSPTFRQQQREALETAFGNDVQFEWYCGPNNELSPSASLAMTTITTTRQSSTDYSGSRSSSHCQPKKPRVITVIWHDTFNDFLRYSESEPSVANELQPAVDIALTESNGTTTPPIEFQRRPTFIVGQEFLDALPIYAFEKATEGYWRERLVDVAVRDDIDNDDDDNNNSSNSKVANNSSNGESLATQKVKDLKQDIKPRLRIVLAPEVTPPLKTLLNTDDEGFLKADMDSDTACPIGSVVEVCPEAILLVQDVARYIQQEPGSAALFIDYGSNMGSYDSLRGYSRHEQVPFISLPGQVDITSDVDFAALKHSINHTPAAQHRTPIINSSNSTDSSDDVVVRAFGPVTQGEFLMSMGVQERVINLMERDDVSEEQAENLYRALVRLASPEEMGERYKVLAIAPTTTASTIGGKEEAVYNAPAGF